MKITKLGHCCLVIEEDNLRILIDPGSYTVEEQKGVKNIDVILITQKHGDHFHTESLKTVLQNNPNAKIYTNRGVGTILKSEGIPFELLEHGHAMRVKGILIEAFGDEHAVIYPTIPNVVNTGYFIDNRFFYPGDAFVNPGKPVEILALPVAGPWLKISEAIDYAKEVHPKKCFPVHDGMLKNFGPFHNHPKNILTPLGIEFFVPEEGKEFEA